ncbi:aldo/keto reductase [Salsuginibacillus kocurii]|uniref:aldo/keto reductase n=1 Tax=Salsuginibacillus kocurii TaxID=427078 RepID=UPI00037485A3|nr:aldo/keto reductase [Salsuginibacillus kocurii]
METIRLGKSQMEAPHLALGCMRMDGLSTKAAAGIISQAMDAGINFFDHADIYGGGASEEIFAEAVKESGAKREEMTLQTKCGIRDGYFDFSKEHILNSVEGSLQRLNTDYIDILLLHRPDTLMEPEEVADAFTRLKESGKVRHFGVSNHNPMQVELLKKYVDQELIVNQLQFGIMHTVMLDAGLNVNMQHEPAVNRDDSVLEYSRLNEMTIQAWSPFQHEKTKEVFVGNDKFPELNAKLSELAETYGVNESAIATAWILRHPAKMQAVVGTMNTERLKAIAEASGVALSREEWYAVYRAAGNVLP